MNNYNLEELKQQLWDATDYGRQFFEDEFSFEIARNRGSVKGFAIRYNDDTGSCHIHQKGNNPYTLTDFGDDRYNSKGKNAIDYVQMRDNCTFWEALRTLLIQYGISLPDGAKIEPKVEFSANVSETLDHWEVAFFDEIKHKKLVKRIFPFYTDELLKTYHFKEIKSYVSVGQNEKGLYKKTTDATDDFPIFGYDKDSFVKIYQPMAPKGDKFLHKHSFIGEKTGNRIIYGWDRLFRQVNIDLIDILYAKLKLAEEREKKDILKDIDDEKIDSVIIATGGTDGINIASLGYDVIWFNSETEVISSDEYYQLSKIAKNIYYVPDLDETGVRQAVQVAEKGLDIKIVWLPKDLISQKKKDFRDWICREKTAGIEIIQAIFKKMLSQALNFRFWDFSDKGAVQINATKVLHFLQFKNFYTYKMPFVNFEAQKDEQGHFVQLKKNRIEKVLPSDMRRFVIEWIDKHFIDTKVRNKVITAPIFNQTQLKMLPFFEYQKNHSGRNFQWYFFNNKAVKVTKESIGLYDFSQKLGVCVWEDNVINHNIDLNTPYFETYKDDLNRLRIKITNKESAYLKVLINTSRVFWEKDANETGHDTNRFGINSKNLSDDENYMQELHLMNKMYCVGYLLHQYKIKSQAYLVLGVDFKQGGSVKGSYGGTGKTFLQESLECFLKVKNTDGKTFQGDSFPFDGVTPQTNLVIIDDLAMYQKIEPLNSLVTSNFIANQKGGVKYNIPFDDAPKVGATTNFAPVDLGSGSSQRRLLIYHNSDYYHQATDENQYPFSRKIADDFNGEDILRKDYPSEKWNYEYNFMLQCLQFYFSQEQKIEAPLDSLLSKNYLMKVGDTFIKFFRDFFEDETNLNNWVEKAPIIAEAKETLGKKFVSAQDFMEKLTLFCKSNNWSLETKKKKNAIGNSVVHFFIGIGKQENQIETIQEVKKENDIDVDGIDF
ncbi:hypothetical protein ACI75Y_03035 [Capnocytophaga stomatis]|uniref:hypothetical protein n=1 Tax=Capnocytophaga stomatis TaxID=1848904 RepID=UPI00385A96E2